MNHESHMNAKKSDNAVLVKVGESTKLIRRQELVALVDGLRLDGESAIVSLDGGTTWSTVTEFLRRPVVAIDVDDWQQLHPMQPLGGRVAPLSEAQARPRRKVAAFFAVGFISAFTPWVWISILDSDFIQLTYVLPGFALLSGSLTVVLALVGFVAGALELTFDRSRSLRTFTAWSSRVGGVAISMISLIGYLMLWWLWGLPTDLTYLRDMRYTLEGITVVPIGLAVQCAVGVAIFWCSRGTWSERNPVTIQSPVQLRSIEQSSATQPATVAT